MKSSAIGTPVVGASRANVSTPCSRIEEHTYAVEFDFEGGAIALHRGQAAIERFMTPERQRVVDHLHEAPGATPQAIAEAFGEDDSNRLRKLLHDMKNDDQVEQKDKGRYYVKSSNNGNSSNDSNAGNTGNRGNGT